MFLIAQPWHCFLSLACLSTLGHKDETHREWFVATGEDANWLYFYFCLHLYLTQFRAARRDQIRLGFENALEIWHSLSPSFSGTFWLCAKRKQDKCYLPRLDFYLKGNFQERHPLDRNRAWSCVSTRFKGCNQKTQRSPLFCCPCFRSSRLN